MSLGSNGVDYVLSLRKIPAWLRGTSFRINCTNSPCFASSFMQWRNGCVRCVKSRRDFVARIFALIAPVHTILHRVSCRYETIPNAPKQYDTHQTMSLGSNWWIGCVRCEKSGRGFMARTFALIAPVHTILHRFSCSYETITNAPKHN